TEPRGRCRRRGGRPGRRAIPDPSSSRGRRLLPQQGQRLRPLDPWHAPAPAEVRGPCVSTLTLVRHGQASFFSEDYDRLSPIGEAQSRNLGAYWVRLGETFSEVYVGPLRRQQRTAELVGEEFRRAGLRWPEPTVIAALNEYDLAGLLGRFGAALA